MRVTILGSGSRGNATLVEAEGRRVLVDAGVPVGALRERLTAVFGHLPTIDGVVVTHAHGDHAAHAAATSRLLEAPVYVTEATRRSLRLHRAWSVRVFGADAPFDVRGLGVRPLPVPHDAPQVALVLEGGGERVGIATDLGDTPRPLARHFAGCGAVLIEANHDPRLLQIGPYPPTIKQRVGGPTGHLANEQTARFLRELGPELATVVLLHVSEANNRPDLALRPTTEALSGRRVALHLADADQPLQVLARRRGQLPLPL
ncbi:MAG TPA: MBL fold metallo-hydrolase [Polyangiaceae bacterium LLY-WYZ-14_1]|nr:MBL fold metallo-hydrolase [Polyangiaceae bacterium LLY-WYZ-14_1]